jgi:hypothetical protein
MIVRWRTDAPSESRLSYGLSVRQLHTVIHVPGARTEHEIRITGLIPNTVYHYAIGTPTQTLAGGDASHFFRTSPLPGMNRRLRIWVIGDSGTANSTAAAVRDAYVSFAGADPAALWLMLGDNAYGDGTDSEYTAAVFQMYPQILRNTVLWPSPGNHDMHASNAATQSGPYFESFTLPTQGEAGGVASGTEAYYSFDYGNVHFVAIESDETPRHVGSPMYNWLELDLQANDKDFVIVYWHHPPYSKGSHDSDSSSHQSQLRENFVPLLEDYGVDLQLSGHSHSFERSMLIDGHYGKSSTFNASHIVDGGDGDPAGDGGYHKPSVGPAPHEGAIYSVVGSSGKSSSGKLDHPIMVRSIKFEGSMLVEVEGRTLRAWWIGRDGVVQDHFEISKGPPAICSDGLDNDADGLVDSPADPGCADPSWPLEDPQCNDGRDNDGDSFVDSADPQCFQRAWSNREAERWYCGLGFELGLILPPVLRLDRRRRRTRSPSGNDRRPGGGLRPSDERTVRGQPRAAAMPARRPKKVPSPSEMPLL